MRERVDREAAARILARAQELEASGTHDDDGVEPGALIAAASEVGIDPDAVRDSLAIERFTLVAAPQQRFDRLAGPASIVIERDVALTVADTLTRIEEWLATVHRLVCDRRNDGTLVAHRRTDASAQVGRVLAGWRGDGRLGGIGALEVQAVPQIVGSTPARPRTLIRIAADRERSRGARLGGGGTLGLAGAGAGVATAALVSAPVAPIVALPFLVGGYAVARAGRSDADRLELELERLVSMIERGERPAGLLDRAVRRARNAAGRSRR